MPESIALVAALFATIALSIDAMLPALPVIAAQLSPDNANLAQLVVTGFVFGVGLGMRQVTNATHSGVVCLTLVLVALNLGSVMPDTLAFAGHIVWPVALFARTGLTMGNLNALAMEPLVQMAGLAVSVATVGSVMLAVPVGQMFDGTAVPLMLRVTICAGLALMLLRYGVAERAPT